MGAFSRVLGGSRREDELATERAAYAEIGRIVAIPFTVANVYERFADEVSKIIPFDLIVITCTDIDRSLVTIMYALGLEALGMSQGDTISLKDSVVFDVANAKKAIRTDQHPYTGQLAKSLTDSGLISRVATPLIANDQVVGTLHLGSIAPDIYGELELARLEIVGNQIAGAIASSILLQAERDRASQLESLYNVAGIIAQPLSFEVKAQRIVDALISIEEADYVVLRRGDDDQVSLRLVASAGSGPIEFQPTLKITDVNYTTLKAYLEGKPILIDGYNTYRDAQPEILAQGLKSMYFMPIRSANRTLRSLSISRVVHILGGALGGQLAVLPEEGGKP